MERLSAIKALEKRARLKARDTNHGAACQHFSVRRGATAEFLAASARVIVSRAERINAGAQSRSGGEHATREFKG